MNRLKRWWNMPLEEDEANVDFIFSLIILGGIILMAVCFFIPLALNG